MPLSVDTIMKQYNLIRASIGLLVVFFALESCSGEKTGEDRVPSLVRLDLLLQQEGRSGADVLLEGPESAAPSGRSRRLKAILSREKETLKETTVSVVADQVPFSRSCRLRIPEGGTLSGRAALMFSGAGGDLLPPVFFRIDVLQASGKRKTLFSCRQGEGIDLSGSWREFVIDLSDMAGETVELHFETGLTSSRRIKKKITALWGNLMLFTTIHEQDRPNIIMISLDTLRADHLGCYGYERNTSPFIDSLARHGVRFSRVTANAPMTTPSHMSIMTSLYPQKHGVLSGRYRLKTKPPTLAAVLSSEGYLTAAFTEGGNISSIHGFDLGFDYYWEKKCDDIQRILGKGETWLEKHRGRPFFLFLHTYQPHEPYRPHQKFTDIFYPGTTRRFPRGYPPGLFQVGASRALNEEELRSVQALYDGEIRYCDASLDAFYHRLEEKGLLENTLFIILSDHGEGFMEHRLMGHGNSLYEEALHIPLIFHMPAKIPGGRVIQAFARSIDIAPTILEIAACPLPASFTGVSLFSLFDSQESFPSITSLLYLYPRRTATFYETHALRTPRYKYISSTDPAQPPALFDLDGDPGEEENLASSRPRIVREMKEKLDRALARHRIAEEPDTVDPDARIEQELRELGYIE